MKGRVGSILSRFAGKTTIDGSDFQAVWDRVRVPLPSRPRSNVVGGAKSVAPVTLSSRARCHCACTVLATAATCVRQKAESTTNRSRGGGDNIGHRFTSVFAPLPSFRSEARICGSHISGGGGAGQSCS